MTLLSSLLLAQYNDVNTFRRALYAFNVKVILIEPGTFTTNITARGHIVELVTKAWNQASDEIKAEYGEEYLKYSKCCVDKFKH